MYGDALTTKERIKDRLTITEDTFDDLIDTLILSVTTRISKMCNRRFTQATFTNEFHDGSDIHGSLRTALILKNAPLGTVSSVQYRAGYGSSSDWTDFDESDYEIDAELGVLYFHSPLPRGKINIRVTYAGGFSGYSIGVMNYWTFGIVPAGTIDGVNLTFTLPEDATQITVYVDGMRESASNITFTAGSDEFTLADGRAPGTTIVVDYLPEIANADSEQWLPADLVDVAERAVSTLFKRRESEGRQSESFGESAVTWKDSIFSSEDLATIKNYRRGYSI